MAILITGGAGFIGSNFIRYISKDYNIINYDKLTYAGNKNNLKDIKHKFIKGDINNLRLLNKIIKKHKIKAIVNFAAETHVDRSINNPNQFIKTNVLGTQTLLELTKMHNLRFHQISSDEVFGELKKQEPKFNENSKFKPNSPYAASKAAADHLVNAYHKTYKLKTTISNCSNNYGPYQYLEKLMPLFITNLIDDKKVGLYGNGKNIRDWLHVIDHCRAIKLILEQGTIGETYCIGGNNEKTNLEITKLILKHFKKGKEMIKFIKDRPGHDFRYAINSSKIKKQLNWKPKIDFNKGLKHKINWYKNNEWWWRPLKS